MIANAAALSFADVASAQRGSQGRKLKHTWRLCALGCGKETRREDGVCWPCSRTPAFRSGKTAPGAAGFIAGLADAELEALAQAIAAEARKRQARLAAVLETAEAFGGGRG